MSTWTPLHAAAAIGDTKAVQALLTAAADPNARHRNGQTPLFLAAHLGDTATVSALLAAGADPTVTADGGVTALHLAAYSDYVGSLAPNIAARDAMNDGRAWTPQHVEAFTAAWERRDPASTCAALLAAGADPDAKDFKQATPRNLARERAQLAFRAHGLAHDLSATLPSVSDWRAARTAAKPLPAVTPRPRL